MDAIGEEARLPGSAGSGVEGMVPQHQHHHAALPPSTQGVYAANNLSYSASPHHNSFLYASNGELSGMQSSQFQPAGLYPTSELAWNSSSQHLQAQSFPSQDVFRHFSNDHTPYTDQPQTSSQQSPSFTNQFGGQASIIASPQFSSQQHTQRQQPQHQHQQHQQHQHRQHQHYQQQLPQQHNNTISPAQVWNDFSSDQPVNQTHSLPEAPISLAENISNESNYTEQQTIIPSETPESVVSLEGFKVKGCPWITIVDSSQADRSLLDAIAQFGFSSEEPVAPGITKKAKTSATTSSPKNSPLATPTRLAQVPAPPRPKIPTEPAPRLKYLIEECLDCDDDFEDVRDNVNRLWTLVSEIQPQQTDLVAIAVKTILKGGDEELLTVIGKVVHFSIRVRKWVVHEFNTNKRSVMVYNMLRLFSKFRVSLETYEQIQWKKVLKKVEEKAEFLKSREIAAEILRVYDRQAKARARKADTEDQRIVALNGGASSRANGEKDRPGDSVNIKKEPGSNLNVGVKRKSEDDIRTPAAVSAVKRVAVADGRLPVNSSKSAVSTGLAKAGTISAGDKKLSKNTAISTVPAADQSKTKTVGFFKSLQAKSDTTKPQAKPVPKSSAVVPPPLSTTSFTSIFDQLKQRQKQEQDREKALASKGNESDSKNSDGNGKKKKKTVRWKTGDDLAKVKVIEWIEPEGEYYGGGNGVEHDWDSARSFDVEEGREALAALKNRNFIDEEEDYVDWYQPNQVDFSGFLESSPNVSGHPQCRGGNEVIETEESKARTLQELTTLAAFYTSAREIPDSPKELDVESDVSEESEKIPTEIPLPENLKKWGAQMPIKAPVIPQTNDLSSLLSSLQQKTHQPTTHDPTQTANSIVAQLQASLGLPQSSQTPPAVLPQVQAAPQLDLTSLLSAVAQFNPGAQQSQQTPQIPPRQQQQQQASYLQAYMQQSQQQPGQQPNTQITDLLARLAGGFQQNSSAGITPPMLGSTGPQNPALPTWAGYGQQTQAVFGSQDGPREDSRSGRDIRRELREQAGWNEKDQPLPPASSNDGGNAGRGGKWEKKHKKSKADKKAKQQHNQQQGNPNVPCTFYQKGNCRHGDSCRFSHNMLGGGSGGGTGNGGGGGKRKHGGRGVEVGLGAGAATGGWPTPGEMEY